MIDIQDSEYVQIRKSIGMHQPESPILCIFVYEGPEDEVNRFSTRASLHRCRDGRNSILG